MTLDLREWIRDVPDFPRPGIVFKDITPLLADPRAFAHAIDVMAARVPAPDAVVAIESRGFLFGTGLALRWHVPLIPARKPGKLPRATMSESYALEYGQDSLEMHSDALRPGSRVLVVDDLLATGGTAAAVTRLVERMGAKVTALLFLIELRGLGGRERLADHAVEALIGFDVDG